MTLARWESKSGKWWVELYRDAYGCGYKAVGAGGNLGNVTDAEAIATLQSRINDFQPDANKVPMQRVK